MGPWIGSQWKYLLDLVQYFSDDFILSVDRWWRHLQRIDAHASSEFLYCVLEGIYLHLHLGVLFVLHFRDYLLLPSLERLNLLLIVLHDLLLLILHSLHLLLEGHYLSVKLLLERLKALELSHGIRRWQCVAAEGELLVLSRGRMPEVVWRIVIVRVHVIVVASVLVKMARCLLLIVRVSSFVPPLCPIISCGLRLELDWLLLSRWRALQLLQRPLSLRRPLFKLSRSPELVSLLPRGAL